MSQIEAEELKNEETSYSISGTKRPHNSPHSSPNQEPKNKRQKTLWNQIFNTNTSTGKRKKYQKRKQPNYLK